ncbi:hypothetical protein AVEN_30624-1 [Araneus ventricosus]|uniref:THAP-type domain-containing protein n=1 Tax=Araneus ventricosus TaxID=182803 RepID=A0A4Y2H1H4_ARAVE|nr:hypothetical protein AVEN_30624-1 [Araneus ventricosus]
MVAYCCAYNCNEKGTKGSSYSFHSFPRDGKRRREWEKSLHRENFKATNSTKNISNRIALTKKNLEAPG